MNTKEQATIASILKSLSESKTSDPHEFLKEINKAADHAIGQANISPVAQTKSNTNEKNSFLDINKLKEEPTLLREQIKSVEKTAELVERLESAGYQRPEKDGWVSEMLNNHQRGYLQSDIFTEAAVGLVWMAAKLIEKAIVGSGKGQTQDHRAELVSEIKGELAKINKYSEKQLAHSHIADANIRRESQMSAKITEAREAWKSGDHQRADKMIIKTYENLASEAKKQYMHYQPSQKHQKIVSEATAREKQRAKTADKTLDKQKERGQDKGLGL